MAVMLNIEYRNTSDLIPYANNSRTHSDDQVTQIASSIKEFGFTNPVLIDEQGGIIAGHGRVMAARKLAIEEVPTITLAGLSEAQKKAYVIADNKLALNAGWDEQTLAVELEALKELDFDLSLTGFDADELNALLEPEQVEGLTDEDAVPEAPETPVTVEGDIWLLGNHRLMCGDSTSIDAVEKLMDGKKTNVCVTSPPYNGDTKSKHGDYYATNKTQKFYGDNGYQDSLTSSDYIDFAKSVLNTCFDVVDGYIFWNVSYNANSRYEYIKQIEDHLEFLIEQICWKKSSNFPLKGSFMRQWEPIFVFSTHKRPLGLPEVTGNHWEISNTGSQDVSHKACFPVGLPEKAIAIFGGIVSSIFDPFGGSGTTMIAAEKQGITAYLMELDPKYCDLIIKRWQEFTGKEAIHAHSGKTYNELAA